MKRHEVRVGYYSQLCKDDATGENKVVLKPHNPEVQGFFERHLRAGTKRRVEAEENSRSVKSDCLEVVE